MSVYKVNERDVLFNLFEYLNIAELIKFDAYKDHSEEIFRLVLHEALKFTVNELDPLYLIGDREPCQWKDGKVTTPKGYREAIKKMAENGFIGIDLPTTHGGQNLPILMNAALYELFTGANPAAAIYLGLTRGAAHLIESAASQELAKIFCPKMIAGTYSGTMCLTEPQAGTAVGDIATVAVENTDGTYKIRGNKIFISGGEHDLTENIIHMVLARIDGDPPGTKGLSLFLVPKIWVSADGNLENGNDVICLNIEHKLGIKASPTCSLNFGENNLCRGYLVGERCKGMSYMFQMMNEARVLCGIQGLALGGSAYENAVQYAQERTQGGDTLIIDYPDVRRNLALCRAWIEGMRALIYKTAWNLDVAASHPDERQRHLAQNRADLLTPVCKAYCSDFGFRVTEIALQVYGGYGYTCDYPVEQLLRDCKIASIYEGANGIQAIDLMARKLALREGELFKEFSADLVEFCERERGHVELGKEVIDLQKVGEKLVDVALTIAAWARKGETKQALLSATSFLEMVGHTIVAQLLLEQAILAHKKNKEQAQTFYTNKVRTARFFVANILPKALELATSILSGDRSALDIVYGD